MKNHRKQDERRADILSSFERLVAKYGVDKTTMRDVANQMGFSVGTLYNEFKDKEELVAAMMKRELDLFITRLLEQEKAAKTIEEKLYILTVVRTQMLNTAIQNNQSLFEYLMREPRPIKYIGRIFGKRRNEMDSIILERLEDILTNANNKKLIRTDKPRIMARIFLDAFHSYSAPPDINPLSQGERMQHAEAMYKQLFLSLMVKAG